MLQSLLLYINYGSMNCVEVRRNTETTDVHRRTEAVASINSNWAIHFDVAYLPYCSTALNLVCLLLVILFK